MACQGHRQNNPFEGGREKEKERGGKDGEVVTFLHARVTVPHSHLQPQIQFRGANLCPSTGLKFRCSRLAASDIESRDH